LGSYKIVFKVLFKENSIGDKTVGFLKDFTHQSANRSGEFGGPHQYAALEIIS